MPKYLATVQHDSLPHARAIEIHGTFAQAKRAAAAEFRGEQQDYEIILAKVLEDGDQRIIASRFVGSRRWTSRPWTI